MGSFGDRLRREREMRGVSLDDIAEATKIGTRLLRALEEEHFELLPGGIFNKGFVRAYAKYLGLNEEEAVADYLQAAGESSLDPRVIAEQNSSRIDRATGDSGGSRMAGFPFIPVLILLLVIAAGVGGWHIYQEKMQDRRAKLDAARAAAMPPPASAISAPQSSSAGASQPEAGTAGTTTPTGHKEGTSTTEPASPTTGVKNPTKPGDAANSAVGLTNAQTSPAASTTHAEQPFEVVVRPKDRAWVSIKQDGKITVRGIIGPPDVKTIRARDEVVFWTGNAGAIELSFNGQPVPITGGPNEVAVIVITPKGAVAAKPVTAKQQQPTNTQPQ